MKNDEKIMAALLSSATLKAAASKAGVSERCVRERMHSPEFRKRYDSACMELISSGTRELQKGMENAVHVLEEIAYNRQNSPQIRLNAANAIITQAARMTEFTDILSRLKELEERYGVE